MNKEHSRSGFFQKHFHSLPARILGVFIIQALLTLLLLTLIGVFLVQGKAQERIPVLLEDYVERLLVDLPDPSNQMSLRKLHQETGLHFGFRQNDSWLAMTRPRLKRMFDHESDDHDWNHFKNHTNWRWQFDHGHLLVALPYQQGELWIHFGLRKKHDNHLGFWVGLTVISLMLVITYFWIRHLLKPIKKIQQGIQHFAEGNFEHRLNIQGKNDLAELSDTVNHMAEEIANRLQKEHELFIAMSHELRTPLARMRVAIEMLDDSDMQTLMLRSLKAMEELITALLEREKALQNAEIETQMIDQKVLQKWVMEDFVGETRIRFQLEHFHSVTDGFALRLILKNLIVNALKYGEDQPVTLGVQSQAKGIEIWVEDQGLGMSEAELQHLFEPFYRADQARARQTGGLGLGLYLSQALSKRMGSQITVQSEPNQGSRFSVLLTELADSEPRRPTRQ